MMITWMPTPYTAQDILDGKGDEYIDTFVKGTKSYREEIWFRPFFMNLMVIGTLGVPVKDSY